MNSPEPIGERLARLEQESHNTCEDLAEIKDSMRRVESSLAELQQQFASMQWPLHVMTGVVSAVIAAIVTLFVRK